MLETLKGTYRATRYAQRVLLVRIVQSRRRLARFASSIFSDARSLKNVPWSIRRVVQRDVSDWTSFNRYRRGFSLSLWARLLMHAGEHPVWLCLLLPVLFLLALVGLHLLPDAWIPHGWTSWHDSEQLGYFSTLWSVQATLAALAYPIVIAFVAVFLQRRPAADSFMHLYMLTSGALAAGLSSLVLVVVMGAQYVAMPYFGASILLQCGALDSVWFLLNAILTAHFLFKTVEFLRPDVQLSIVRRYVANVALPREVRRLYLFQVFAQSHAKGWIPAPDYLDDKSKDMPKVLLTRFGFGRGEQQGMLRLHSPSRLINVRLWPLWLVVAMWARAARRWPRPANGPRHRRAEWPLLTVPITPGTEYRESVALAQVEAGPNLSSLQRRLLRSAFVFRNVKREKYDIRVKSVIEEFELDARTAAGNADAKAFERAYNALIELHELLLGASLVEAEDGSVWSWAMMPDTESFFALAMHVNWNNAYRSVFFAAIETMTIDNSLVRRVCHIGQHFNEDVLRDSPVEIREGILDLPMLLMYQLGNWWVQRIEEQGVREHGPHQMASLGPPLFRLYEDVVSNFIGGWENARTHIAEIPEATDAFEWRAAPSIARVNAAHIQGTARMLLAAVMRGDRTAAEWLADSLSKWWGNLLYEHQPLSLHDKTAFVTVDDLKSDWPNVAASLGLSEQDGRRMQESAADLQRGVLLASLLNLWTDIRLVSVELLLFWACQHDKNLEGSLALEIALAMLTGKQWRGGGTASESLSSLTAADYLAAKVRQYASGGHFRGGYVGLLSQFVERVKDMQQPGMISSRSYSSVGLDDLRSLEEQQLILMAMLSAAQWAPSPSLQRQFDVWVVRQYPSIDVLRNRLRAWLDRLNQPTELSPHVMTALLQRTGNAYDAVAARAFLKGSLESLNETIESRRNEILQNEPVDPDRLAELSRFSSQTAFNAVSGAFPLRLFNSIGYTVDALQDFTLTMLQIRKGELTRVEMDQRASNEAEFWAEAMRNRVGALVLSDVLRGCNMRGHAVPDAESYWTVLQSESQRMIELGQHPVLLLENPTKPEWVWQWQHADFGLGYQKPNDLRVWHASGKGHAYVCNFNEIEVCNGMLASGESILLPREVFREVDFQRFGDDTYVEATHTTRSDSNLLVDIHLKFSRRVEVVDGDAVRLVYVPTGDAQ